MIDIPSSPTNGQEITLGGTVYTHTDGKIVPKAPEELAVPEILTGVETLAGYKRNGKDVYQKEIDFGALPNTTIKSVAHGVTGMTSYWISFDKSYTYSGVYRRSANIVYNTLTTMCETDMTDTAVRIQTWMDRTSYSAYIVIYYTK